MRIPEAQERSVNTAPNVGGLPNPDMNIIDTGAERAGDIFNRAMQNASEGFVKMYLADQRADAIHAYDDYNKRLQELLKGNVDVPVDPATGEPISDQNQLKLAAAGGVENQKLDPQTGLPIGFLQLKGDQITDENLDAWRDKANNLRAEFDRKIKGYVPDIRDEFTRRADEEDLNFNQAIGAHFLKGKYDKAASAAKRDNENIMNNTTIGLVPDGKGGKKIDDVTLQQKYNDMYNNNMAATQDSAASEELAKQQVEKLIENNVIRIRRDGGPDAYDNVRVYLNSQGMDKFLSEKAKDSLLHDNDLEDVQWQMLRPGMDTATLKGHIKRKITNLSPKEKEVAIATQMKTDAQRAGGIDAKKVSDFEELVSVVGNGQPDFFLTSNKYGISIPGNYSQNDNIQFQSQFLTFADSVLGGLTYSNADRVRKEGLSAILPEPQIRQYLAGDTPAGKLMATAYRQIDKMFKTGQLSVLNSQQTNYLKGIIANIRKNNYNFGEQARYRRNLEYNINQMSERISKKERLTPEEMEQAMTNLNQYNSLYGTEAAQYGDTTFFNNSIKLQRYIEEHLVPTMSGARGFLNRHLNLNLFRQAGNWAFGFGDTIKTGMNKADVNRNLDIIADLTVLANADGKMADGRRNIIPVIAKEIRDMGWQMMHGDGLSVMRVRTDGTVDNTVMAKGVVFPMDKVLGPDGVNRSNTSANMYRIENKFAKHLNQKYNTSKYTDFMQIDLNELQPEDVSYLQELTRREILSANGYPNATYAPLEQIPLTDYTRAESFTGQNVGFSPGLSPFSYNPNRVDQIIKDRQNAKKIGQYVGPLDRDLNYLRGADFLGGSAGNAEMAMLVSEGYSSYEDKTFMNNLKNPVFSPSETANLVLESLAPLGSKGGYFSNLGGLRPTGKRGEKLNTTLNGIIKDEEELVNKITARLAKDNPDMNKEDFLTPHTFGYNVSSDTLKFITEEYLKIRPRINAMYREIYDFTGGVGIDKTGYSKENASKQSFVQQFENADFVTRIDRE